MGRLIDADAVVERLQRRSDMFRFDKQYEVVMRDAIGEVLTAPAIDAVPVVRCKDCKYAQTENGIWYWCCADKRKRPSSFYCSAGRKKDEYDD